MIQTVDRPRAGPRFYPTFGLLLLLLAPLPVLFRFHLLGAAALGAYMMLWMFILMGFVLRMCLSTPTAPLAPDPHQHGTLPDRQTGRHARHAPPTGRDPQLKLRTDTLTK